MRPLGLFSSMLLSFSSLCWGSGGEVYSNLSLSQSKNPDPASLTATFPEGVTHTLEVGGKKNLPWRGLAAGFSFARQSVDFDRTLLRSSAGEMTPLRQMLPQEELNPDHRLGANLTYAQGPWLTEAFASQTVNQTPYPSSRWGWKGAMGLNQMLTTVKGSVSVTDSESPEDYFADYDYKTRRRPTFTHKEDYSAGVEQVLSERWKTEINLLAGNHPQVRPNYYGVLSKVGYGASDRLFFLLSYKALKEDERQALKNERGFFTVQTTEGTISIEPLFDWLVSLSAGYMHETEEDPRTQQSRSLGSTIYGLGSQLIWNQLTFQLSAKVQRSFENSQSLFIQGGTSWQI